MKSRYEALYYVDDTKKPFLKQKGNNLMILIAKTTIFIDEEYPGAYCEVWDNFKHRLVSTMKRTYCD